MRRFLLVGFALSGLLFVQTLVVRAEEFFIANWNVENLFDTVDDPNVTRRRGVYARRSEALDGRASRHEAPQSRQDYLQNERQPRAGRARVV